MKASISAISLLVVGMTVALSGCGGDSGSAHTPTTTASEVDQAIAQGAIPQLDVASGPGPDTDNNGVRDDIDAFINNTYGSGSDKAKAATQAAAAIQAAMVAGLAPAGPTQTALDSASQQLDDSIGCLTAKFQDTNAGGVLTELEAATTNTKERFLAYEAFNKAESGRSRALANTDLNLKCK